MKNYIFTIRGVYEKIYSDIFLILFCFTQFYYLNIRTKSGNSSYLLTTFQKLTFNDLAEVEFEKLKNA
jgi:hypothetical protein